MPAPSDILTRREAADYSRFSISSVDRAIKAGRLRCLPRTPGGSTRVLTRRMWVDDWLAGNYVMLALALALVGCMAICALTGLPCPLRRLFDHDRIHHHHGHRHVARLLSPRGRTTWT